MISSTPLEFIYMATEIIPTDKGWRIKTGTSSYLKGYFKSFVMAEAEEEAYIKRNNKASEKQKKRDSKEHK